MIFWFESLLKREDKQPVYPFSIPNKVKSMVAPRPVRPTVDRPLEVGVVASLLPNSESRQGPVTVYRLSSIPVGLDSLTVCVGGSISTRLSLIVLESCPPFRLNLRSFPKDEERGRHPSGLR